MCLQRDQLWIPAMPHLCNQIDFAFKAYLLARYCKTFSVHSHHIEWESPFATSLPFSPQGLESCPEELVKSCSQSLAHKTWQLKAGAQLGKLSPCAVPLWVHHLSRFPSCLPSWQQMSLELEVLQSTLHLWSPPGVRLRHLEGGWLTCHSQCASPLPISHGHPLKKGWVGSGTLPVEQRDRRWILWWRNLFQALQKKWDDERWSLELLKINDRWGSF